MQETSIQFDKPPIFIELLNNMEDPRDNRGKRHELSFVLAATIVAILSGKTYVSEIHRYMRNKIEWFREKFNRPQAKLISRAQLPRLLAVVDWQHLNNLIEDFFGVRIACAHGEWVAIDGKALKGTITDKHHAQRHEQIVIAVGHTSQKILFQRKISDSKSSEVAAVRQLIQETSLVKAKLTFDSLHATPDTLEPINQEGGKYIVQIKKNQPKLFETFDHIVQHDTPTTIIETTEKGHGRLEERSGRFFPLQDVHVDQRWHKSGLHTLIVIDRETEQMKYGKRSSERSYYVSNEQLEDHEKELFNAIRGHWKVESNNYIRDVTFNEDHVKTKNKNQGQILSLLRTVAVKFIRNMNPKNFKEVIDSFGSCHDILHKALVRFKFL